LQTRSVRGTFVMNTFDSVCERYSPAAHAMVLQLPPSAADLAGSGNSDRSLSGNSLVAYMKTEKTVLVSRDPDFYRQPRTFPSERG